MGKRRKRIPNLAPTDSVVLYPSFGHLVDNGSHWRISVHGTVFESGEIGIQKRILIRLLRRVMQATPDEMESELFRERIRCFIAQTEGGKRVGVRVGSQSVVFRKGTKRNGQFQGAVRVAVDEAKKISNNGKNGDCWIGFDAVGAEFGEPTCYGKAQLLGETGVSVITDIDDTIKDTEVTSRRELLANTFLREFRSIDGMAEVYRAWADLGAAFHYVSSSPWQLYEPLERLRDSAGFPPGSFHLRSFRLRDHMLRRMLLVRRPGKSAVIRSIVSTFPRRRFLLVGDSGEKDPEIYAALARKFPQQIHAICIRQLPDRRLDTGREEKLLKMVPREKWHTFTRPDQIAQLLPTSVAESHFP